MQRLVAKSTKGRIQRHIGLAQRLGTKDVKGKKAAFALFALKEPPGETFTTHIFIASSFIVASAR